MINLFMIFIHVAAFFVEVPDENKDSWFLWNLVFAILNSVIYFKKKQTKEEE